MAVDWQVAATLESQGTGGRVSEERLSPNPSGKHVRGLFTRSRQWAAASLHSGRGWREITSSLCCSRTFSASKASIASKGLAVLSRVRHSRSPSVALDGQVVMQKSPHLLLAQMKSKIAVNSAPLGLLRLTSVE